MTRERMREIVEAAGARFDGITAEAIGGEFVLLAWYTDPHTRSSGVVRMRGCDDPACPSCSGKMEREMADSLAAMRGNFRPAAQGGAA